MANVENLEKKLLELINTEDSFAVALTGEWGIGKTYLWKNFRDNNEGTFTDKKYAYVSLFGLDSLESLKLAIATEVHTINGNEQSLLHTDISTPFKKLFSSLSGGHIVGSGGINFGINIGSKLVTNLIMSHLKDTLVCLDDIERKTKNLPMSWV